MRSARRGRTVRLTVLTALAPLAASDDACGAQSRLSFLATSGIDYKIAVDGYDGDSGQIALAIRNEPPPPNDDFAGATTIVGSPSVGDNIGASAEEDEPLHGGGVRGGASVWWRWTPQARPVRRDRRHRVLRDCERVTRG